MIEKYSKKLKAIESEKGMESENSLIDRDYFKVQWLPICAVMIVTSALINEILCGGKKHYYVACYMWYPMCSA